MSCFLFFSDSDCSYMQMLLIYLSVSGVPLHCGHHIYLYNTPTNPYLEKCCYFTKIMINDNDNYGRYIYLYNVKAIVSIHNHKHYTSRSYTAKWKHTKYFNIWIFIRRNWIDIWEIKIMLLKGQRGLIRGT